MNRADTANPVQQGVTVGASDSSINVLVVLLTLARTIQLPIIRGALTMGHSPGRRLRVAFLSKIPKLSDRYFHSRVISDMAERCHGLHRLRFLPILGTRFLDGCVQILFMIAGIAWLEPRIAPGAVVVVLVSIGLGALRRAAAWVASLCRSTRPTGPGCADTRP